MTTTEIRAFAERCRERRREGLMISPGEASALVAEALGLLADQREQQERSARRLRYRG